ncbi:histidine kinase [Streptomyces sp. TRM 70361]|uniref:sensor histidine kinase n=1 Tax=Streptomyces sp. TRM 70361 TaxID=3116553 RepID=UPI002E7ADA89|nr:histidine kinase [Streptomyces sp. TRM 70361]MEE1942374.1 histidine kinase [Streptomyces sp. TRM 70361]
MRSWRGPRPRAVVWSVVAAVPLFGLGLLDHDYGMFHGTPAGALKLGCALLAAAALLLSPWLGPRGLPASAGAAAVVSLGTTAAVRAGQTGATPPDPYGLTEPVALLALLALVAWRAAPVWAAVTAPALIAAVVLRPMAAGVKETGVVVAFFFALTAAAALGAGLTVRLVAADRRRREAAVRLEQRAEFARDLHDFVAHHVTGIVVQAQGARTVADRKPHLVPPALERIERAGTEALTSMRAMVGMLRGADPGSAPKGAALTPLAGIEEVRSLVAGFAPAGDGDGGGGGRARLRTEGEFGDLPVEVTSTVHRVVMEALTNVCKHARDCTEVDVRLVRSGGRVTVEVSDDGRSRSALGRSLGGGFGLRGLTERVNMIGGSVRAGPAASGGWTVRATLPVEETA